jgi:alkylhydroperoxidase family enzyme
MSRIRPLERHEVAGPARAEYDRELAARGRLTNMKRTLAHSPVALRALMEWYPLEAEVKPFLGERATHVFVHAISAETDCLICSTFFRRRLVEAGDNPDALVLDEQEQLLVAFGRQLAKDSNAVSDEMYASLARRYTPAQIVSLTAFAAMMIATNVFNNALAVDLDDHLKPFTKGAPGTAGPPAADQGGVP